MVQQAGKFYACKTISNRTDHEFASSRAGIRFTVVVDAQGHSGVAICLLTDKFPHQLFKIPMWNSLKFAKLHLSSPSIHSVDDDAHKKMFTAYLVSL